MGCQTHIGDKKREKPVDFSLRYIAITIMLLFNSLAVL